MSGGSGTIRPMVVFIGGFGRSGSTLLERLLGQLDGVVTLGEVVHLWHRGIQDDDLCGCGSPFSSCPFWSDVGQVAFGGWGRIDVERVSWLAARVDRLRHTPQLAAASSRSFAAAADEYASYYERLYRAAAEVSGARVLVDSSKHASTALALRRAGGFDLRALHIVRDPRGVAYSWAKEISRPETGDQRLMPRYSASRSTALWMAQNVAFSTLQRQGEFARMRYEDLVADPAATVTRAWRTLGLPGDGRLQSDDGATFVLGPSHSVAGNPMRFRSGPIEVRGDDAWRREMPAASRRVVTAVGMPLMLPLGYLRSQT